MIYFKCVSIIRRLRENRRRVINGRRAGDSSGRPGGVRNGSGSDGSSLIGGGGRLRRNGSRSHTVSASKMRGSFNRSQSGFLSNVESRKGSSHDLSDIDSLV